MTHHNSTDNMELYKYKEVKYCIRLMNTLGMAESRDITEGPGGTEIIKTGR